MCKICTLNPLQNQFNFDILPIDIQDQARNIVAKLPIDDSIKISDKIRLVLKSDLYELIKSLPDKDICKFLKSSHSLFSLLKNQIRSPDPCSIGRPTKLLTESEQKIHQWLVDRAKNNDFPTKREFKGDLSEDNDQG
ncbi:hypothetical protein M9Y10_035325 [Tritrichomonas musculus]|uniref:Uncharacterized protein n=1 Tax=Tritrichomonas musculus TaxID=1915356 RepID=A0ABR2KHY0_9EUKA